MRTAGGAGGQTHYRLSVLEAVRLARYEREATFNESMPDEALTIQGEVTRAPGGLYLRCDRTPGLKMKDAMAVAKDAWGVHAKLVLDHFLWPNSLDDVEILLDTYPDHVVEFSTYDRAVGDQPRRNTIIWEVRSY